MTSPKEPDPPDVPNFPEYAAEIAAQVASWGPLDPEALDRTAVLMRTELERCLNERTGRQAPRPVLSSLVLGPDHPDRTPRTRRSAPGPDPTDQAVRTTTPDQDLFPDPRRTRSGWSGPSFPASLARLRA